MRSPTRLLGDRLMASRDISLLRMFVVSDAAALAFEMHSARHVPWSRSTNFDGCTHRYGLYNKIRAALKYISRWQMCMSTIGGVAKDVTGILFLTTWMSVSCWRRFTGFGKGLRGR